MGTMHLESMQRLGGMEARIVANSDGNADRVLQVVGAMAEEVRRAFSGLDESMCRLTVEAALGNAQSSEGLDRLAAALLEQLQVDRAWLLQQIDSGRWPDLRLDLAALERELGQLLEQAQRRLGQG